MSFKRRLKRNAVNKPLSRAKLELVLKDTDYKLFKNGKLKCAFYKDNKIAIDMTNWRKVALAILSHSVQNKKQNVTSSIIGVL